MQLISSERPTPGESRPRRLDVTDPVAEGPVAAAIFPIVPIQGRPKSADPASGIRFCRLYKEALSMQRVDRKVSTDRGRIVAWLGMLGLAAALSSPARADSWAGYGKNAQHTALAAGPSQLPQAIRWSTPVDLAPQYVGGELLTHYGSPLITAHNTVLVPVKTQAGGGFEVMAVAGSSGNVLWTFTTDYTLPAHNWIPPMGIALGGSDLWVAAPGAGGTILIRNSPDFRKGSPIRKSFLGMSNYNQNPAEFNQAIHICTPLTVDPNGNIYFGYMSSGAALPGYPNGVPSGLARLARDGTGAYVSASHLSGGHDPKVTMNCAPAISTDGKHVYVATNKSNGSDGYLCRATADANLTPSGSVYLVDPATGKGAWISDDGTAAPTVGLDGDVYYGVLESNLYGLGHHDRGWLLHYNSTLQTLKTPGSFGWDLSPAIVPSTLVKSYTGHSSYLVLTKYNNYANAGGDGKNKVAVLDPDATEPDPIVPSVSVMKEVITVLGPTKNSGLPGVREWCINSAAVDQANRCAVINSEDGNVYRWSFSSNTLSPGLSLAPPTGEAYTPTVIGPDGAVYAINNAKLCCCIAGTSSTSVTPSDGPTVASAIPAAPPSRPIPPAAMGLALALGTGLLLLGATLASRRLLTA
jgi:hypothetical protein